MLSSFILLGPSLKHQNQPHTLSFSYLYENLNQTSNTLIPSMASFTSLASHTNPDDGELDIFTADKYFQGSMDEDTLPKPNSSPRKHQNNNNGPNPTPKLHVQTPSIKSESSWNSQNPLLRSRPARAKGGEPRRKFFAALGCNCTCADENSIDIVQESHSCNTRSPGDLSMMRKLQLLEEQGVARKSLEVFGTVQHQVSSSFNLERKLNMLAWDAIPKADEAEIPRASAESVKDSGSEASSDLFEIECLSRPATCYAPSEASVEWSVVTASAAEFSVLSDAEDLRPKRAVKAASEAPRQRYGGILSGCKKEKAVWVAQNAYAAPARRGKS